jgi:hypothetical protein
LPCGRADAGQGRALLAVDDIGAATLGKHQVVALHGGAVIEGQLEATLDRGDGGHTVMRECATEAGDLGTCGLLEGIFERVRDAQVVAKQCEVDGGLVVPVHRNLVPGLGEKERRAQPRRPIAHDRDASHP